MNLESLSKDSSLHSYPTDIINGLTAPVTPGGLLPSVVEIKNNKNPISLFYQDVTASSFKGLSGSPVFYYSSDSTANINDSTITTKESLKFCGIASALNSKQFFIVPIKYLYKVMAKLP